MDKKKPAYKRIIETMSDATKAIASFAKNTATTNGKERKPGSENKTKVKN